MSYQGRLWTEKEIENRKRRIKLLAKKANISKRELTAVTPFVAEKGKLSQRKPFIWRATEVFLGVLFGATVSAYAVNIVDSIMQAGLKLPNIFPPY